jgi:uncharacterized integral membrane protein
MNRLRRIAYTLLKIALFIFLLLFLITNGSFVDLNLLFLHVSISVQLLFVLILVLGIIIGYLLGKKDRITKKL